MRHDGEAQVRHCRLEGRPSHGASRLGSVKERGEDAGCGGVDPERLWGIDLLYRGMPIPPHGFGGFLFVGLVPSLSDHLFARLRGRRWVLGPFAGFGLGVGQLRLRKAILLTMLLVIDHFDAGIDEKGLM